MPMMTVRFVRPKNKWDDRRVLLDPAGTDKMHMTHVPVFNVADVVELSDTRLGTMYGPVVEVEISGGEYWYVFETDKGRATGVEDMLTPHKGV